MTGDVSSSNASTTTRVADTTEQAESEASVAPTASDSGCSLSATPTECPSCDNVSKRKRRIRCTLCNREWHLTCVRLKRNQAVALSCWWCPSCVRHNTADSIPHHSKDEAQPKDVEDLGSRADELAARLARLKQSRKVISRIPRAARILAADALATLLEKALLEKTAKAWARLFEFPLVALAVPSKRKRQLRDTPTLTSILKRQICSYMECSPSSSQRLSGDEVSHNERPRTGIRQSDDRLKKVVSAKLSDGDIRGAIRLLASNDAIVQESDEAVKSLTAKHPASPPDLSLPPRPDGSTPPILATEADVSAAIATFNTGSGAGLDGLRPAHLKDMTGRSAGEAGLRLTTALTGLVNTALSGELPEVALSAFYGASLIALRKPSGGIRPIAVGSVYRRLASKTGLRPLSSQLGQDLRPVQLGYGTPGGCEAAVHASRQFYQHMTENSVMVKVDMANAFNTVRRDHFLRVVREHAPALYPLLWQAYSQPTPLYYGTTEIASMTGVQQGDPCGPAVFALAIHQAASDVTSCFNCWYLDDGTIGGHVDSVCEDLKRLIPAMAAIGLALNHAKCEIIVPREATTEQISCFTNKLHSVIPGAAVLKDYELTTLGAPLTEAAAQLTVNEKKEELERMLERLQILDSHSAFFLLCNSLWLPKLQYLLRASPMYRQREILQPLDDLLKMALTAIANVTLGEESWKQAVLPVRHGGLGLRRTLDVALPSYVASLHSSHQLLVSMLPTTLGAQLERECTSAVEDWLAATDNSEVPHEDAKGQQRAWDTVIAKRLQDALLESANQFARARLQSAATPESGAWLDAIPSGNLGTLLDSDILRIAIALRIGADVCSPHQYKCGAIADNKGCHALTCRLSACRLP